MSDHPGPPAISLRRVVWYGDVIILALCAGLVLMAFLTQPSMEDLTLFGYSIPPICAFRNLFGIECLGCGVSRSWSFLAHGQVEKAFSVNMLGPFVFALAVTQIPYRLYKVWRDVRRFVRLRGE